MDINGASAIVTGGASGIGAACARQLAAKGAKVVVADLNAEGGGALAEEIGGVFAPVDGKVRPRTAVYGGLGALFDPTAGAGVDLRIRLDLDGEELWLEVRDGRIVRPDRTAAPDLVFTGSAAALVQYCRGTDEADLASRLEIAGTAKARRAFERCFLATAPATR